MDQNGIEKEIGMNILWSKEAVAQKIATELDNSLQLLSVYEVNLAHKTTVAGNARAKETINGEKKVIRSFVSAMQKDIERIRSVAAEFEKMDDSLQRNFINRTGK
ncbi:TIGR04197 family type VII secretion effector [Pueribacillus sp. YX66]|uniref:TIGR04197 family type VII secretion effector n=1 Tax=Pueribacillus sp. YX66 TaxID=3229242 RepID=UPI00358D124E